MSENRELPVANSYGQVIDALVAAEVRKIDPGIPRELTFKRLDLGLDRWQQEPNEEQKIQLSEITNALYEKYDELYNRGFISESLEKTKERAAELVTKTYSEQTREIEDLIKDSISEGAK